MSGSENQTDGKRRTAQRRASVPRRERRYATHCRITTHVPNMRARVSALSSFDGKAGSPKSDAHDTLGGLWGWLASGVRWSMPVGGKSRLSLCVSPSQM